MWAGTDSESVTVNMLSDRIIIYQDIYDSSSNISFWADNPLDGLWHKLTLVILENSLVNVFLDDVLLLSSDEIQNTLVNFTRIIDTGDIVVGGLKSNNGFLLSSQNYIPLNTYRGCFGPLRINGFLLPYFSEQELINNTAQDTFIRLQETGTLQECQVCFNHECHNGGFCSNPQEEFNCECPIGFEGDVCQVNIDDCVDHQCVDGSSCMDLINDYKCICPPGYQGNL